MRSIDLKTEILIEELLGRGYVVIPMGHDVITNAEIVLSEAIEVQVKENARLREEIGRLKSVLDHVETIAETTLKLLR